MPTDAHRASCFLKRLLADHTTTELRQRLWLKLQEPAKRVGDRGAGAQRSGGRTIASAADPRRNREPVRIRGAA